MTKIGIKNAKVEPYTWKAIAATSAVSLAGIAQALTRIADVREADERLRALLVEFDSHRADSSVAWIDDWTRRVKEAVGS